MGNIKLISTCLFLLVLIICNHEFVSVEGRHLKLGKKVKCISKKCSSSHHLNSNKVVRENNERNGGQRAVKPMGGEVEAFRPTTPGHSPGVGHSLKNL
ncbi:hypothetical protein BVC80_1825g9 [Macleaya cordata]|uniref:Uncharacterized protein n=1 Tax=Macleaya cordata TaxID=56857 RepID=A0A200QZ59_MACCD|nr:hypothetical protein BVC80_1825g9 [Macleaya cordata]